MKKRHVSIIAAAILAALIMFCRFNTQAADFYSLKVYPVISAVLSFISSAVPFSLNDIAIAILITAALVIAASAVKRRISWKQFIVKELTLALWTFVWFYAGWCTNYSRSDIFTRIGSHRVAYDEQVFKEFLEGFTDEINGAYVAVDGIDRQEIERQIKSYYSEVPEKYGLCTPRKWQHTKPMLARRLQSAVGVTGYMGPLGCEFHVNDDVLPESYPFTFAHEYAHLMGVSNEAEANWWGFQACRASEKREIRYSAYFSILTYVWNNAYRLLDEEEFLAWRSTVNPEIINDMIKESEYWTEMRIPALDKVQTFIYDLFLKANNIGSGIKNYSEVVQMLISLDSPER